MDKILCYTSLGVAALLLIVFGVDLAIGYPFGGGVSMGGGFGLFGTVDLVGVIASGLAVYLAIDTLRELR